MGPYDIIRGISNQDLFRYVVITIVLIAILRPNIFLALFFAFLYIWYDYNKLRVTHVEPKVQEALKIESITPPPINFIDKEDIIDFVFSIQDWYNYNPQAYEEMTGNLEMFFELYTQIKLGSQFCDQYYQLAEVRKQNALNALHSMIYTIPTDKVVMDKFNRAHRRLDTLLTAYQNKMYNACQYSLLKDGYNINRSVINKGPKEYNVYDDKNFTYQFY